MNALKIADSAEDKKKLDAKCKQLLSKAEEIKHSKSLYPPNIHRDSRASHDSRSKPSEPLSTRELSTREQIILLEGAKLNGFVFPPWGAAPVPQEFELIDGDKTFLYVFRRTPYFAWISVFLTSPGTPQSFHYHNCSARFLMDGRGLEISCLTRLLFLKMNQPQLLRWLLRILLTLSKT